MTRMLDCISSFRELILADICALMISQPCSSTDTLPGFFFFRLFPREVEGRILIFIIFIRDILPFPSLCPFFFNEVSTVVQPGSAGQV